MSLTFYRTEFRHTFEKATKFSNLWSKGLYIDGSPAYWEPQYLTPLKGEPIKPNHPLECWAITNEFDPRIEK